MELMSAELISGFIDKLNDVTCYYLSSYVFRIIIISINCFYNKKATFYFP